MMFLLDLAFTMELIALGFGVVMLVWASRNNGAGVACAKIFGYIITIAAASVLLCTSYYGVSYWTKGYFASPMAPMMKMMQEHPTVMDKMKKNPQQPGQS